MNANLYNIAEERARRDPDYFVNLLAHHPEHNQRRKAKRDAYYREKERKARLAKLRNSIRCALAVSGAVIVVAAAINQWLVFLH